MNDEAISFFWFLGSDVPNNDSLVEESLWNGAIGSLTAVELRKHRLLALKRYGRGERTSYNVTPIA